ncbi:hypothetical protein [Frankia sp. CiP3]|uniref:hypothetical protein n=1 Tax=Frankia sp. CiP3 TaxID=2880971 RepID=UPI001EF4E53F|nr:hypothetical protein [Frankia sp. CiP3]
MEQAVEAAARDHRFAAEVTELAELTAFCADDGGYSWWRAGPWAGKTALMSSFVLALSEQALEPQPWAVAVSFFITGRLAGQDNAAAFTDALLGQLQEILGQGLPEGLTPEQRDGERQRLLREAARHCKERGSRLVLVVDGLDEDRGPTVGQNSGEVRAPAPRRRVPYCRSL